MATLHALADLHLSTDGSKPMDVFGEAWVDHASRMARFWDARVDPEDLVLLAGDLSWARKLTDAGGDLEWIGARPGRKLLLRGNHDSWWQSLTRVRSALPAGCDVLQNDAHTWQRWVIVGARGWLAPDDPLAGPQDARVFARELDRLDASLADADRRFGRDRPRIAMTHYPPWLEGREPTEVVARLQAGAVRHCVYGHLHGEDHALAVRGLRDGIEYHFVAADAVRFQPVPILTEAAAAGEDA